MDVSVDVIDPFDRDNMVMLAVRRIRLCQLDAVAPLKMIDRPDVLAIGRFHFHMFFDLA